MFSGKRPETVLITGASSGVGEALAIECARRGVRNIFICGRNAERLSAVVKKCEEASTVQARVVGTVLDVTDAAATRTWIEDCDKVAPLEVVFSNAGIGTGIENEENVRRTFATNVGGGLNVILPTLDLFRRTPTGADGKPRRRQIVITASIAGYAPLSTCPSYAGTKAAMKSWGLSLRGMLKREGIWVNVVCPGFIRSRITDRNTCPMPFFMEADRAARIILSRVDRNVGLIAFPWPMRFGVWLMSVLPWRISELISRLLPEKTASGKCRGRAGETIAFAAMLLTGAFASAAPFPVSVEKWDANPVVWSFRDNAAECSALGGFATYLGAPRAAKVTVSATVTPAVAGTNGWATFGVALIDDNRNFWHLALVQAPLDEKLNPGKHFFELCESRDGTWLAQNEDHLKVERSERHGTWQYGKTYLLTLKTDGAGIQGEVRDAGGRTLFVQRYAFPAPAKDGTIVAVTCGHPGLHANGGFRGRFAGIDVKCDDPCPRTKEIFPPYVSDSFVTGVVEKASGFFRVVQRSDGRWWAIDPLGRGTVLMGVDHIRYNGHWSQRTKRSVHHEVNKKKFPNKRDWEKDTLRRLKEWGFNLLGAGCDPALERRGLIHTRFLSMGDSLCWEGHDDALWICPNEHRPCSAFPNVFDPVFPTFCDYIARRRCAPNKDDPWLFGYFIDNELAWWGRGALGTGLFDAVMKKPETHSAKVALRAFLKERGVTGRPSDEVKLDFLRLAAERYFGIASAAIRRHDPNHLVMGARFAGIGGAHDVVWEVAGKYCDLVTFNIYPWADLDRNVVFLSSSAKKRVTEAFAERYALVKRPMLITEWSFPALDSGLPCTGGAGQRFRTQRERTAATELFAKTMLATPNLLGYDYFMWVDEPEEGISDAFPEDSNYGLINLQGEAYPEITKMFTALQKNIGCWRQAPLPVERPAPPQKGLTADSFAATLPAPSSPGGVAFARDGDTYTLTTRGGLGLSGRVGGGSVFSRVALNGTELGRFTAMVSFNDGGLRWHDITRVTDVDFSEKGGWGLLKASGEFRTNDGRQGFALTLKIALHPDRPYFIAEVTKAINTGTEPLDVRAFYLRQYAPYAADKATDKRKTVPNLWKATFRDVWVRTTDGAWWGGFTKSPACSFFRYFLTNSGRNQHPDAMFELQGQGPANSPEGCWRLAPGASYDPQGTVWELCIGGTGGYDGWKQQVSGLSP